MNSVQSEPVHCGFGTDKETEFDAETGCKGSGARGEKPHGETFNKRSNEKQLALICTIGLGREGTEGDCWQLGHASKLLLEFGRA